MDNNLWIAFFFSASMPSLLTLICLISCGLAFLRQRQLGGAAVSGGLGFAALAAAFAIGVVLSYLQISAVANHQVRELATLLGIWSFGGRILEIAGVVLVAVAVFQRRPAQG